MNLLHRAVRFFLLCAGLVAGFVIAAAYFFAQRMIQPPRRRLWVTPDEVGLPFDPVQFPADDGVRLSGWFIPAAPIPARGGATAILVHGWPWNRLGNSPDSGIDRLLHEKSVDLLRLAHALHHGGYNVLTFDLRNHGESAAAPPVAFGLAEASDLLGAIAYAGGRADVDAERIGVVGFSMGGNAALFALPRTSDVKAAVIVQPTSAGVFARRYAEYLLGPLARPVLWLAEGLYQSAGGVRLDAIEPVFAAHGAGDTPVLFVQGAGDPWGSAANVANMVAATPNAVKPVFVESYGRFDGYKHVTDNPGLVTDFFDTHL